MRRDDLIEYDPNLPPGIRGRLILRWRWLVWGPIDPWRDWPTDNGWRREPTQRRFRFWRR